MKDIVHLIVVAKFEQSGEKLCLICHQFLALENILLQDKTHDLDDLHPSKS